jgi:hypothetical protein
MVTVQGHGGSNRFDEQMSALSAVEAIKRSQIPLEGDFKDFNS